MPPFRDTHEAVRMDFREQIDALEIALSISKSMDLALAVGRN